ncbi:MAG: pyridoxamine 5'-phosphate oxidase family protein [Pseudomonadota bacterium]
MSDFTPTEQTRVKRSYQRAHYDRETLYGIIDAASMCHIGYAIDGQPYVTTTFHWRIGHHIYWHGSSASKMLRHVQKSVPICINITHFDGFVIARSAFHHSANYRTAMLFGAAQKITGTDDKRIALHDMMEHFFPGRLAQLRDHTQQELKATTILKMPIEEAVAKIRTGPPIDDAEDYETAKCWAGVVSIAKPALHAQDDGRLHDGVTPSDDIRHLLAHARL